MKYQFNSARCDGHMLVIQPDHQSLVFTLMDREDDPYQEVLLRDWQVAELAKSLMEWLDEQDSSHVDSIVEYFGFDV